MLFGVEWEQQKGPPTHSSIWKGVVVSFPKLSSAAYPNCVAQDFVPSHGLESEGLQQRVQISLFCTNILVPSACAQLSSILQMQSLWTTINQMHRST